MRTALEHLSSEQKDALYALIKTITTTISVDKIICYGTRVNKQFNWSCYNMESFNKHASTISVDLLLIPGKNKKQSFQSIIKFVHSLSTAELSLTCLVHSAAAVNDTLSRGHTFFTSVCRNGTLLYGQNWNNISPLLAEPSLKNKLNAVNFIWNTHFTRAQNLLKGAGFFLNEEIPEYCVLALVQAVQQTAIALLHSLLGYRPNVCKVYRLLPLLEHTGITMNTIFPQNTAYEKELLNTFINCYSEIHYNNDFEIPLEIAASLHTRIQEVMHQSEIIFHQESQKWRKQMQMELQASSPSGITLLSPLPKAA